MSVRSTNTVVIKNIHVIAEESQFIKNAFIFVSLKYTKSLYIPIVNFLDIKFGEIQMPEGTLTCISEYVIHRPNQ